MTPLLVVRIGGFDPPAHFSGSRPASPCPLSAQVGAFPFSGSWLSSIDLVLTFWLSPWQPVSRSPSWCPFFNPFFGWEGSPTKIDYRKKLVPTYSNLSTGGPRFFGWPQKFGAFLLGPIWAESHPAQAVGRLDVRGLAAASTSLALTRMAPARRWPGATHEYRG